MKKLLLSVSTLLLACQVWAQSVGVNTSTPNPSSALDVSSSNQGFLPPRLTTAQRDAISSPAAGLQIYNTDTQCMEFYNSTKWVSLCATVAPCSPPPASTPGSNSPVCAGQTLNLTATAVTGATYVWSGPNGFSSTAQNPSISNVTTANAGTYTLRTWLLGCYSDPMTVTVSVSAAGAYRSCNEVLLANPGSTSGVYTIDVDGAGSTCPMQCYCDMTTDGGGWTLVLNYLHKAGTNPALNYRSTSFPLLNSTTLGNDESGTAYWGHVVPSLLGLVPLTETRFYAVTSNHARVMHFKTTVCANYFKSGSGSCAGIATTFTALAGHNTNLPGTVNNVQTNLGNDAMLNHPFWEGCNRHWNLLPGSSRWEEDNCTCNCCGPGCTLNVNPDTYHQIWVR